MKTYKHVALGGTFDHIHDGHKALLDKAFAVGQKVSIGVTDDDYNHQKVMFSAIQNYDVRYKALQEYLTEKGYMSHAEIFPLHDIYGPTTEKNDIEALVVSKETLPNARIINRKRQAQNMPQLKIVLVQLVKGEDLKIIRSKRIRMGEIDRHGSKFIQLYKKRSKISLSETVRAKLRKPLGEVIEGTENERTIVAKKIQDRLETLKPTLVISVGDFVTASMITCGLKPNIAIIDFKTRRIKNTSVIIPDESKVFKVRSAPGQVSRTVSIALTKAIHSYINTKLPQFIVVTGEEDLAALVALHVAPLNSIVMYGQYGLGVVLVAVTEEIKESVRKLLENASGLIKNL